MTESRFNLDALNDRFDDDEAPKGLFDPAREHGRPLGGALPPFWRS